MEERVFNAILDGILRESRQQDPRGIRFPQCNTCKNRKGASRFDTGHCEVFPEGITVDFLKKLEPCAKYEKNQSD